MSNKFTLIEMLVVIAIISILASMLAPSLQNAMNTARLINCSSNHKQLGTGLTMYLHESNGNMPDTNGGIVLASEGGHTCDYRALLRPYYVGKQDRYYWDTADNMMPSPEVEHCPSDDRTTATRTGIAIVSTTSAFARTNISFYKKPSQAPMYFDNDFTITPFGSKWWSNVGGPGYTRHCNLSNFWCLDGHVETRMDVTTNKLWSIHTYGDKTF